MDNVRIGEGDLHGRGVFAARDFREGEIVIAYRLRPLSESEFEALSAEEKDFVHSHFGKKYLYSEPERFVNHSENPNTRQDLIARCDIAARPIRSGEQITTDATKDDVGP